MSFRIARPFHDAAFMPFDAWVRAARAQRQARTHATELARRKTDFTDAVEVVELDVQSIQLPDWADTVPCSVDSADVQPIVPEVIQPEVPANASDRVATLLSRAETVTAQRAFQKLLWQGYFPPRCQHFRR